MAFLCSRRAQTTTKQSTTATMKLTLSLADFLAMPAPSCLLITQYDRKGSSPSTPTNVSQEQLDPPKQHFLISFAK
jgi:hypothetical protein